MRQDNGYKVVWHCRVLDHKDRVSQADSGTSQHQIASACESVQAWEWRAARDTYRARPGSSPL